MRILICKNCGFNSDQSSSDWKIKVIDETGKLQCPKCDKTEFIRLNLEIENLR